MGIGDHAQSQTLDGSELSPAVVPARLAKGATVGRYLVLSMLGAGGMGVVFAAYDPELDRKVALKLLHPSTAGRRSQQHILREAQVMAQLGHPNVVAVHDIGEHEGQVFIAMELVEGRTLADWLDERPRTWREIVAVFLQAGEGVAAAHRKGIVHRDFKPANAMIDADGRVRVLDLGLARPRRDEVSTDGTRANVATSRGALRSELTIEGSIVGTPGYMAPEQLAGLEVGPAADQFAFCVALYTALHGRAPFTGDSLWELAVNVSSGAIVRDSARGVPARLRRVVVRGLAPQPGDRWPTMDRLLIELRGDPALRKRRVAYGIAASAIAVVAGAAGLRARARWAEADHATQCVALAETISEIWHERRRETIVEAFVAVGKPFARDSGERVVAHLDAHAQAWADARRTACMAAPRESPPQPDVAQECLDHRRQRLDDLVDRLEDADAAVVINAVRTVLSLPPPEQCLDPERLAVEPSFVAEGAARPQANEIRRSIERSELERTLGDPAAALALAQDAVARSQDVPGTRASASRQHARILAVLGDYASAHASALDAFFVAGTLRRDDEMHEAAIQLLAFDTALGHLDDADMWERHAQMLQRRLELADDHPAVTEAVGIRGALRFAQARFADAAADYEYVLQHVEAREGRQHPSYFQALDRVGNAYHQLGDIDAARQAHVRALAGLESVYGPDHPSLAGALNNLAIDEAQSGRLTHALELFERAMVLDVARVGEQHPEVALRLRDIGLVLGRLGRHAEALPQFERAIRILEATEPLDRSTMIVVLANAAVALLSDDAQVERTRAWAERALAMCESEQIGPGLDCATAAVALTQLRLGANDLDGAMDSANAAMAIYERAALTSNMLAVPAMALLAKLHSRRGAHAQAVAMAARVRAVQDASGYPDPKVTAAMERVEQDAQSTTRE